MPPRLVLALLAALVQACRSAAPVPEPPAPVQDVAPAPAAASEAPLARTPAFEVPSALAATLAEDVAQGRLRIEAFFSAPFPAPFEVTVFPDRAAFDAYFDERWGIPRTEAWMVAAGVGDHLLLLSPSAWRSEAAEHDPDDPAELRELVFHELVHVYHGQHNPRPDFDGLDPLGWFVEGLATLVSGQLEHDHRDDARAALASGAGPKSLAEAWSGRYRYGVCGSLVEFVDQRYGREMLRRLLAVVDEAQALEILGTSEEELLSAWRASVTGG